jgi:hypothetical protein
MEKVAEPANRCTAHRGREKPNEPRFQVTNMSDGTQGAVIELRPLLQKFIDEAVTPIADQTVDTAIRDAERRARSFP